MNKANLAVFLLLLILALVLLQSSNALAGKLIFDSDPDQVTLLELLTSQGCSRCLPVQQRLKRCFGAACMVFTEFGEHKAAVANVIPPQKAATIAASAGLTDDSGWCPVDPFTFESKLHKNVHVIGDACMAGPCPSPASRPTHRPRSRPQPCTRC